MKCSYVIIVYGSGIGISNDGIGIFVMIVFLWGSLFIRIYLDEQDIPTLTPQKCRNWEPSKKHAICTNSLVYVTHSFIIMFCVSGRFRPCCYTQHSTHANPCIQYKVIVSYSYTVYLQKSIVKKWY